MEKMIKSQLKNGKVVTICTDRDFLYDNYYSTDVFDEKNNKIAYLTFTLKNSKCFLMKIEITNQEYAHVGLGSILIEHMEDFAMSKRCSSVDGRFYPFGELGKHARNFYEKHNYKIFKDGYETYIFKYLELNNDKTI